MSLIVALFTLCLSFTAMAGDSCSKDKAVLDTSIGAYRFKTVEQCVRLRKMVENCQEMNLQNSKLEGGRKLDCHGLLEKKLKVQIKRGNAEKVSDK